MRPESLLKALRKSKDLRPLPEQTERDVLNAFNADRKRQERKDGAA